MTEAQGGRGDVCGGQVKRERDQRLRAMVGFLAKKVAPPCGELHDPSEQRPPMTSALPHAASSSSGMNSAHGLELMC